MPGSQNDRPHQTGPVASSHLQTFLPLADFSLPRFSSLIFPGEVIKVQALFHFGS